MTRLQSAYLIVVFLILTLSPLVHAQDSPLSRCKTQAAAKSVVRILAHWPGHENPIPGTGFVWGERGQIVTALHLVVGADEVIIEFDGSNRIVKEPSHSLLDADLALFTIDNAPEIPPLLHRSGNTNSETAVMIGHGYDRSIWSDVAMRIRATDNLQLRHILGGQARDEIRELGFPSLRVPVIDLEGNAVPGNSGAPVLDAEGYVIGVIQGGLEAGSTGYTWAVPASKLEELKTSKHRRVLGSSQTPEVFFGDFNFGDTRRAKQFRIQADRDAQNLLVYIGTRDLRQLRATADDQLGLAQLEAIFRQTGRQIHSDAEFDLYADQSSGARVVVPAGVDLEIDKDRIEYQRHNGDLLARIRITQVGSTNEAQQQSLSVEQWISSHVNVSNEGWRGDPNWSNISACTYPNGSVVRRVAYVRHWGLRMTGYAFATYAHKADQFLDAVALQIPNPESEIDQYSFDREWVEMMIATHLTSYSH
ncbi:MAG: trypsin-like peptidase domain-containing protein [Phycisphaeraceae bacterium]|nr:trypsin-like peptidase domain-containing protein [Phycisphaerales bacterium]MCB9858827.1 trypsin-like peptidase domain-containing protein [Phycisphaeraceae bacterium]